MSGLMFGKRAQRVGHVADKIPSPSAKDGGKQMGNVDIVVRDFLKTVPEYLASAFTSPHTRIDSVRWEDTQLTTRERRLDKALEIISDDQRRVLHIEVQSQPASDMAYRVFEYHFMLAQALSSGGAPAPPIKSVVILLSGPKREVETRCRYSTGWPDEPFSGVQYSVLATYQLRGQQLLEQENPFLAVFTPLTRDASETTIEAAIEVLRRKARDTHQFYNLCSLMMVLAGLNKTQNLVASIEQRVDRKKLMESELIQSWIQMGQEKGIEKGLAQGIEKGLAQGIEEGLAQGIEEGKLIQQLRLIERKIGRKLNDCEQTQLKEIHDSRGSDTIDDWLLNGSGAAELSKLLAEAE